MPRHAGGRARALRRARPLVLAGVVAAGAFALPVAVESAVRPAPRGDGTAPAPGAAAPSPRGPHLSTALRCGPAVSSPDGIEAQTCVVARGEEIWARTYYRNASGEARAAALSLMAPGGRTVRTRCAVSADDEPALCETPRERGHGDLARHTAVAEFAPHAGQGRLLLRSGSS